MARPTTLAVLALLAASTADASASLAPSPWCPIRPPAAMTVAAMAEWAAGAPTFAPFSPALREHEMDEFALGASSAESLVAIGLPLGVALKLKLCVDALQQDRVSDPPAAMMTTVMPAALADDAASANETRVELVAAKPARWSPRLLQVATTPGCDIGSVFGHLVAIKDNAACRAGCNGGTGNCVGDWYPNSADECSAECGAVYEPFCKWTTPPI